MNCARCGGQVWAEDSFCARCGTRVDIWTPPHDTAVHQTPPHSTNAKIIMAGVAVALLVLGATLAVVLANRNTGRPSAAAPATQSGVVDGSSGSATVPSSAPPGVTDFATVYSREQSGVVRIDVVGCSDAGIGTGFLLSPTLVATVDHVVRDSTVVSLTVGDQHTTGQVIGSDPDDDLALVRTTSPLPGYNFHFAQSAPRVGDRVATVGFPIGDPITLTQGGVSGLERSIDVDGQPRSGLIETDAPVNPGNSGGPLLAADGTVIGLVDALNTQANGIAYAVPAAQAGPRMTDWTQSPDPASPAGCSTPLGPAQAQTTIPTIAGLDGTTSAGVISAFKTYFDGINSGDYEKAWLVLSPGLRAHSSLESFADGDATSYDFGQRIVDARQIDGSRARVVVGFTSVQSPDKGPDGDSCDNWTLVYSMSEFGGAWHIDGTDPYQGSTHTSC